MFGRKLTVGATHSTGCSQRSASLRMPLQKVKCQALSVLSPSMRTCADPSSGYVSKSRAATLGQTPLHPGPRANRGAWGEESSGDAMVAIADDAPTVPEPNAAAAPTHATSARAPYLVARCFVLLVSKCFMRSVGVTPRSGVFASAGLTATGADDESRVFMNHAVRFDTVLLLFVPRRVPPARLLFSTLIALGGSRGSYTFFRLFTPGFSDFDTRCKLHPV